MWGGGAGGSVWCGGNNLNDKGLYDYLIINDNLQEVWGVGGGSL